MPTPSLSVCARAREQTQTHTHTLACMYVRRPDRSHMYVCVCTCMNANMHVRGYTDTRIHKSIYPCRHVAAFPRARRRVERQNLRILSPAQYALAFLSVALHVYSAIYIYIYIYLYIYIYIYYVCMYTLSVAVQAYIALYVGVLLVVLRLCKSVACRLTKAPCFLPSLRPALASHLLPTLLLSPAGLLHV